MNNININNTNNVNKINYITKVSCLLLFTFGNIIITLPTKDNIFGYYLINKSIKIGNFNLYKK
jgi:hypothetical protein